MPKKIEKKAEELPSFLINLGNKHEKIVPKETHNRYYLGPLFFGGCNQYHPRPRSLGLESLNVTHYKTVSKDNLLENIFLPKITKNIKKTVVFKAFRSCAKRRKKFQDIYKHLCPGGRVAFAPEVIPRVIDLGETLSIIEGETSQEIPLCRLENSSRMSERDIENVTLSDIREKKRPFMSPEERAAHSHFPKEFVTVRVIGPTIPAAITITKLPSKRRRLSGINFNVVSKTQTE